MACSRAKIAHHSFLEKPDCPTFKYVGGKCKPATAEHARCADSCNVGTTAYLPGTPGVPRLNSIFRESPIRAILEQRCVLSRLVMGMSIPKLLPVPLTDSDLVNRIIRNIKVICGRVPSLAYGSAVYRSPHSDLPAVFVHFLPRLLRGRSTIGTADPTIPLCSPCCPTQVQSQRREVASLLYLYQYQYQCLLKR